MVVEHQRQQRLREDRMRENEPASPKDENVWRSSSTQTRTTVVRKDVSGHGDDGRVMDPLEINMKPVDLLIIGTIGWGMDIIIGVIGWTILLLWYMAITVYVAGLMLFYGAGMVAGEALLEFARL
jgi:hypothetical protein